MGSVVSISSSSPEVPHLHQICSICGLTKPIEEFYPRPTPEHRYLRHRQCKDCQKAKARRRNAVNPEPARQRALEYWRNLDEAARDKRRAYKQLWYAKRAHAAGRTYQPRLNSRKKPVVTVAEREL
jgi:hypothetical protein